MEHSIVEEWNDSRNPSMAGIFAKICKGKCWIGQEVAVAYSYPVGGCGIIGEITEANRSEIRSFFEEKVFKDLRDEGIYEFEFSVEEDKLGKQILQLFGDKKMQSEEEYSYRKNNSMELPITAPKGYQMKQVDACLLKRIKESSIKGSEMLLKRIEDSWESTSVFLQQSVAYVAIHEEEIVGVIIGSARYENILPVDIEVKKEHQKQGLATILTKEFVNDCVNKNLVVQWDHVASNAASKCLAEKCEFQRFKIRPYYWFSIT